MEKAGAVNEYVCQTCKRVTVTVNRDAGTTPFMIVCHADSSCDGMATSQFYKCDQTQKSLWQWIRPTPEELERYLKGYSSFLIRRGIRAHCKAGGLIMVPWPE